MNRLKKFLNLSFKSPVVNIIDSKIARDNYLKMKQIEQTGATLVDR